MRMRCTRKSAMSAPRAVSAVVVPPAPGFPSTVSTIVAMGDSITVGINGDTAGTDANPWVKRVAASLSATLTNSGVSGTVLQNSNDSGGAPRASNGRNTYISLTLLAKKELVIVAHGFNDARYTAAPSTFNVANYTNDLTEILIGLIGGGYPQNRIVVVSPYYITDAGLTTGSAGFTGQTRSGFEAFVTASKTVADTYGVWHYNAYAYMRDNGGASLIGTDNIHPNSAGHAAIATGFLTTVAQASVALPTYSPNYVYDTFADSVGTTLLNHSGELGAFYVLQPGNTTPATPPTVDANGMVYGLSLTSVYYSAVQPPSANYEVYAKLVYLTSLTGDNIGVQGRMDVTVNTSYIFRYSRSAGTWGLFKCISGVNTSLATAYADAWPTGTKEILLRMNGSTISGVVDGVTVITATDTAIAGPGRGGPRFGVVGAATTGIHMDTFAVRPLTG